MFCDGPTMSPHLLQNKISMTTIHRLGHNTVEKATIIEIVNNENAFGKTLNATVN